MLNGCVKNIFHIHIHIDSLKCKKIYHNTFKYLFNNEYNQYNNNKYAGIHRCVCVLRAHRSRLVNRKNYAAQLN